MSTSSRSEDAWSGSAVATLDRAALPLREGGPAWPRLPGLSPGVMVAVVVLAVGTYLFPLRTLGTDFRYLPGNLLDARLTNYVLEHGWLFLSGQEPSFWNAPFFYPQPNVLAYSEAHMGTVGIYSLFRAAGLDRETAFQCWFLSLTVLNYVAAAWVLRRFRMTWAAAAAGAYVFAFGMPMVCRLGHEHLVPRFLVPPALYFAYRFCNTGGIRAWAGLGACLVWQWYASMYTGFFLALLLAAFMSIYLLLRWGGTVRQAVVERRYWGLLLGAGGFLVLSLALLPHKRGWFLVAMAVASLLTWVVAISGLTRRRCQWLMAVAALCGVAMLPLMLPYLRVFGTMGGKSTAEVLLFLPQWNSWLIPPAGASLWSWWQPPWPKLNSEHQLFLGVLPFAAVLAALGCVIGCRRSESRRLAAAAALTFAALFVLTLHVPPYSAYLGLVSCPGVSAFRAVARIALVLLFPAGLALAYWLTCAERALRRRDTYLSASLTGLFLLLVFADQHIRTASLYRWTKAECQERTARLVEAIGKQGVRVGILLNALEDSDPAAAGELAPWVQEVDAMMAAQTLGIPTLNGYSGLTPPGWGLMRTPEHAEHWTNFVHSRLGEDRLNRVPRYKRNGFNNLVVVD